jgi:hypothetical protein
MNRVKIELALALAKVEGAREVLRKLTRDADAGQAGRRAHLAAWAMGVSPCQSQAALAARLGVSPARVCQLVRRFKRTCGNSL